MSPVRVKICGLTRAEDARAAVEAGADYLGFIFAPSPRRLKPSAAARLVRSLPAGAERVGVFVNESAERIRVLVREVGLTMVQLHGDEPPGLCAELDVPVIKALRLARGGGLDEALERVAAFDVPFVMIEPHVPGHYGGTGRVGDWDLARAVVERFPEKRVFLAGGLSPENVAEAVARVRPFAVDASSSLETEPGIKDAARMRRFVEAVKSS